MQLHEIGHRCASELFVLLFRVKQVMGFGVNFCRSCVYVFMCFYLLPITFDIPVTTTFPSDPLRTKINKSNSDRFVWNPVGGAVIISNNVRLECRVSVPRDSDSHRRTKVVKGVPIDEIKELRSLVFAHPRTKSSKGLGLGV